MEETKQIEDSEHQSLEQTKEFEYHVVSQTEEVEKQGEINSDELNETNRHIDSVTNELHQYVANCKSTPTTPPLVPVSEPHSYVTADGRTVVPFGDKIVKFSDECKSENIVIPSPECKNDQSGMIIDPHVVFPDSFYDKHKNVLYAVGAGLSVIALLGGVILAKKRR